MSDRIVLNFVFKTNYEEVDVKVRPNGPTSSKKKSCFNNEEMGSKVQPNLINKTILKNPKTMWS